MKSTPDPLLEMRSGNPWRIFLTAVTLFGLRSIHKQGMSRRVVALLSFYRLLLTMGKSV